MILEGDLRITPSDYPTLQELRDAVDRLLEVVGLEPKECAGITIHTFRYVKEEQ